MKKAAIFLILIFFINFCTILNAAETDRGYTAFDKFSRSIFNIITFPLDVPITIYKTSLERDPMMGLLYGLPMGIGKGLIRLGAGAVELTTFAFPPYEPMFELD